jgi:hypothetical protein
MNQPLRGTKLPKNVTLHMILLNCADSGSSNYKPFYFTDYLSASIQAGREKHRLQPTGEVKITAVEASKTENGKYYLWRDDEGNVEIQITSI